MRFRRAEGSRPHPHAACPQYADRLGSTRGELARFRQSWGAMSLSSAGHALPDEDAGMRRLPTRLGLVRGPDGRPPPRSLFVRHYEWMRDRFGSRHLGLAVVAIHEKGEVSGSAWLAARPDRAAAAIIGRHPKVDVALASEDISLRHLAIVIHPVRSWAPSDLRVQIHDLRTDAGFYGEHGERLAGVMAEGALILWCGDYALFALPTGDPTDWPSEPAAAWSFLPERVYLSERVASPAFVPVDDASVGTVITRLKPLMTLTQCGASATSAHLGTLYLRSAAGSMRVPVSAEAARRGILLGSYPRCDEHALLASPKISRVHLLLLLLPGGAMHAIDTASTNKTVFDRKAYLSHPTPLSGWTSLELAKGAATLHWSPA